jgi:hypothetical protein
MLRNRYVLYLVFAIISFAVISVVYINMSTNWSIYLLIKIDLLYLNQHKNSYK